MSTVDKSKRSFLALLPSAPFGAAAAAKEAAASMGLSGPLNAAAMLNGMPISGGEYAGPCNSSGTPWFVNAAAQFMNPETIKVHRQNAMHQARVLDADIAAMRSISPSRAYLMQVDRCFERLRASEKSYIDR